VSALASDSAIKIFEPVRTQFSLPRGSALQGSQLSRLDFPGASTTIPRNLNDKGDIVGYFYDSAGFPHGFSYSQGQWTRIDFPGSVDTVLFGINASGEIVGAFNETQPITHGFRLRDGRFMQIDTPFGIQSELTGINDLGVIAGDAGDDLINGPFPGFTLTNGMFTRFEFPGALLTLPLSINNRNDLAGVFLDPDGIVWGMVTVNGYPQRVYSNVLGYNDLGQIWGYTFDFESGQVKGFIGQLPLTKQRLGP
jgi:probable HAF family extracellular repeat protein